MTTDTIPSPARPVATAWYILLWLLAAIVAVHDADFFRADFLNPSGVGTIGVQFSGTDCGRDGFCRPEAFNPTGPLATLGVQATDEMRFDHPTDMMRKFHAGDHVGFSVRRGGAVAHYQVVAAERRHIPFSFDSFMTWAAYTTPLLVGVGVLIRSRRQLSTVLLAGAFIAMGLTGTFVTYVESLPGIFPWSLPVLLLVGMAPTAFFLGFALSLRRESGYPASSGWRIAAAACIFGRFLTFLAASYEAFTGSNLAGNTVFVVDIVLLDVGFVVTAAILAGGWLKSAGGDRTRYAFMLVAIGLTIMLQALGTAVNLTGNDWALTNPLVAGLVLCGLAGPLIFAYAVLRHRVIDLGFAFNQTLIYGVVSSVVLLLFGLAEWGLEKIMPEAWHEHIEANAFISAGIALCIFLVFHRIRDGVEHIIEGLFFHKWRQNEAALNRFVKQAAHILKPDALRAAAVAEFARFSGGAGVALYRADGSLFVREAGAIDGLDAQVDADLAPLVEMRAEGKPLFDTSAATLHAALVLPMIQRNDLTGFVALGLKPGEEAYRPDERTVLAEAAQKVGLDLHALRIEELETEAANQRQRADILEAQVQQGLRGAIA